MKEKTDSIKIMEIMEAKEAADSLERMEAKEAADSAERMEAKEAADGAERMDTKEETDNGNNIRMKEWERLKENYKNITMPEDQIEHLKLVIEKGKMENQKARRKNFGIRFTTTAAAVLMAIIILPNTSPSVAHAMEQVPFLGNLIRLVTWRDYEYKDERLSADVEVEKLEMTAVARNTSVEESVDASEATGEANTEEVLKQSVEEINAQIEEITNQLIEEFETYMQEEMGYHDLVVKNEVISGNDRYFTLKLLCFQAAGSGYEWNYFYTIDLLTGERIQLKDLFVEGADYITVISEDIKNQMRAQMEADENVIYWLEDEIEEFNFKGITEETSFYINPEGELVISFNEGDVAPMYMGVVEFVIAEEAIESIKKEF